LSSLHLGISLAGVSRPPAWWPTIPPTPAIEPNSTSQYYDKSATHGRSATAPAPPTADRDYCSQSPLQLRLCSFGGAERSANLLTNETCSPPTLSQVLKEAEYKDCDGLAASRSNEHAVASASGNDSSEEPSSLSSYKCSAREVTSKSSTSAARMGTKTDDCSGITKTLELPLEYKMIDAHTDMLGDGLSGHASCCTRCSLCVCATVCVCERERGGREREREREREGESAPVRVGTESVLLRLLLHNLFRDPSPRLSVYVSVSLTLTPTPPRTLHCSKRQREAALLYVAIQ